MFRNYKSFASLAAVSMAILVAIGMILIPVGCDKVVDPNDTIESDFSASPTTGEADLLVHFTNKSRGDISSYHWDFGDGTSADSTSPTHLYQNAGTYSVTLTVSDGGTSVNKVRQNLIRVSPDTKTIEFKPGNIFGPFWPAPKAGCGCAFETHKPDVSVTATLRVENNKSLMVDFSMWIKDRSSDPTEGLGRWTVEIYRAPSGYRISNILSATSAVWNYWDNDMIKKWDYRDFSLGRFLVFAETNNNDLCDDDADDRSRMGFQFSSIRLVLEEQ